MSLYQLELASANWWDQLTREEQKVYVEAHPRTKMKVTKAIEAKVVKTDRTAILAEERSTEYQHISTPDLQTKLKEFRELEAQSSFYTKKIKGVEQELKRREVVEAEYKENPTSLGDISELFQIRRQDVGDYSTAVDVNGITYRVGQGVGYTPIGGGNSIMMDGLVVQGPRGEILKPASEIPALERAIADKYHSMLNIKGGDFAKVQKTSSTDLITRLLFSYKSPLLCNTYSDFLCRIAAAYLKHGQINAGEAKTDIFTQAKVSYDQAVPSMDKKTRAWYDKMYRDEYTGQGRIKKMLSSISDSGWKSDLLGQDSVNQFVAFASATQRELAKKHPKGVITVYRGVKGEYASNLKKALKKNPAVDINVRTVDSWTASEYVARKFAGRTGVVIKKDIPIKSIIFSYEGPKGSGLDANDYMLGGDDEQEHLWLHDSDKMSVKRDEVL